MFFKSNKCYNGGNWHNFKARFSEEPNTYLNTAENCSRSYLYYNKYIYDICTWCGKIIKEESNETN